MVKIRLKRQGNKHRPFYRVVVAKADSGRDGAAIEILGTYNPLTNPKTVAIKQDRALHWLLSGAQPTETVAIIFKREGVLDQFFAQRPNAKASYKFLDKRTEAMSQKSVMSATAVAVADPAPKAEEPKVEAPTAQVTPQDEPEAPVAETAGSSEEAGE